MEPWDLIEWFAAGFVCVVIVSWAVVAVRESLKP